jgi:hypothetical protein
MALISLRIVSVNAPHIPGLHSESVGRNEGVSEEGALLFFAFRQTVPHPNGCKKDVTRHSLPAHCAARTPQGNHRTPGVPPRVAQIHTAHYVKEALINSPFGRGATPATVCDWGNDLRHGLNRKTLTQSNVVGFPARHPPGEFQSQTVVLGAPARLFHSPKFAPGKFIPEGEGLFRDSLNLLTCIMRQRLQHGDTTMKIAKDLYARDFYAWTQQSARLIREGRFGELDLEHLAEEIESMGASERRELINRLGLLLAHLLKWHHQPLYRGKSWELTIKEQRRRLKRLLTDNPSLKPYAETVLSDAFGDAVLMAAKETGLDESSFPQSCPYSLEQALSSEFLPE